MVRIDRWLIATLVPGDFIRHTFTFRPLWRAQYYHTISLGRIFLFFQELLHVPIWLSRRHRQILKRLVLNFPIVVMVVVLHWSHFRSIESVLANAIVVLICGRLILLYFGKVPWLCGIDILGKIEWIHVIKWVLSVQFLQHFSLIKYVLRLVFFIPLIYNRVMSWQDYDLVLILWQLQRRLESLLVNFIPARVWLLGARFVKIRCWSCHRRDTAPFVLVRSYIIVAFYSAEIKSIAVASRVLSKIFIIVILVKIL